MNQGYKMFSSIGPNGPPTDRPPDSSGASSFPKTKCSLWDSNSVGPPTCLHIGYYRRPKVCIPEKIIRLVQHQCENYGQTSHMLIGSLVVEDDGEGVQFQVDRLDTRSKIPSDGSGLAPGDMLIPIEVTNNTTKERLGSVEDYACAFKRLQERCCSKNSIDLCSFLLLRGWGSFYSNAHSSVVHLDFDLVTMEMVFKATPITPVPIVLTALSKNLAGPMSLSHMQGSPKSGYLTMDHTRKLLLILESDPKTATLPIVGIWVSGVEFLQHPFVWAACLRYIHTTYLQDRVCKPPEDFLLVLYSPLHSRPEFYQCCTTTGDSSLKFQLCSGHEVTNITKTLSTQNDNFTEVEMAPVQEGVKMEMFDAAKAKHGLSLDVCSEQTLGWNGALEDIEPRSAPTPHMEKVPVFQPMVPDVSILWTEPSENVTPGAPMTRLAQRLPMSHSSHQPRYCPPQTQYAKGSLTPSSQPRVQPQPPLSQQYSPQYQAVHSAPCQSISSWPSPHSQSQAQGGHYMPAQRAVPINAMMGLSNNAQVVAGNSWHPSHPSLPLASAPIVGRFNCNEPQQRFDSLPSLPLHASTQPHAPIYPVSQAAPAVAGRIPGAIQFTSPQVSTGPCQQPCTRPRLDSGVATDQGPVRTCLPQPVSQSLPRPSVPVPYNQQIPPPQSGTSPSIQQVQTFQQSVLRPPANPKYGEALRRDGNIQRIVHPNPPASVMPRNSYTPMTFLKTVIEEPSLSNASLQSESVRSSPTGTRNSLELNNSVTGAVVDGSTAGTDSASSSNTNSSSRSSDDDSGLSITPERTNPSPPGQDGAGSIPVQPAGNVSGPAVSQLGMDNINWDQIPPEIRTLLVQQNEQLKQLQQQIQVLMQNQSQQSVQSDLATPRNNTASSSGSPPTGHSRSIAVNTTTFESEPEEQPLFPKHLCDSRSVQTSPVKLVSPQGHPRSSDGGNIIRINPAAPKDIQGSTPRLNKQNQNQPQNRQALWNAKSGDTGTVSTAIEPMSKALVPVGSKSLGEMSEAYTDEDASQRELLEGLDGMPVYEHTINTVVSELMVDMPDYVSSVCDRSPREQSPTSVSDCYGNPQDDSYSTVAEDATDPKQYYNQLMNNIQLFLTNSGNQDGEPVSEAVIQADVSLNQTGPQHADSDKSTVVPHINYVSMILGCGSETGQSMEINAMAMKYLNDEQLTHLARLRQKGASDGHQSSYTTKILQQVIRGHSSAAPNSHTPDVSTFGISPCDMTIGTRKYLERHGLLGNDTQGPNFSPDLSVLDQMFTLKTDFSMATSSGDAFAPHLTSPTRSVGSNSNSTGVITPASQPRHQPDLHEVAPLQPAVRTTKPQPVNDENWLPSPIKGGHIPKDLGASPDLRAPMRYGKSENNNYRPRMKDGPGKNNILENASDSPRTNKRNILQEMAPQRDRVLSPESQSSTTTSATDHDEENILDIEMLKQMPKLL